MTIGRTRKLMKTRKWRHLDRADTMQRHLLRNVGYVLHLYMFAIKAIKFFTFHVLEVSVNQKMRVLIGLSL